MRYRVLSSWVWLGLVGCGPEAPAPRVEAEVGEGHWADTLRSQAVCLIRTGNAAGCRGEEERGGAK